VQVTMSDRDLKVPPRGERERARSRKRQSAREREKETERERERARAIARGHAAARQPCRDAISVLVYGTNKTVKAQIRQSSWPWLSG